MPIVRVRPRSYTNAEKSDALHIVSAWATDQGIRLGQVAVDSKSNEITAVPKLLDMLDLEGAIITLDAMGCQKAIAKKIIDGSGDYTFAVKDNHLRHRYGHGLRRRGGSGHLACTGGSGRSGDPGYGGQFAVFLVGSVRRGDQPVLWSCGSADRCTPNGVVRYWVCTGGSYPMDLNPGVRGNYTPDPSSTVTAVRDWPGPIYFTGLGDNIRTGVRLHETPAKNPVRRVYELFLRGKKTRPSWDLIGVLVGVRSKDDFWRIHTGGHYHIFDNGAYEWRKGPEKNHRVVELRIDAEGALRETLDQLMIQSPRAK